MGMESTSKKREVHPMLQQVLEIDRKITIQFCSFGEKIIPLQKWKPTFKLLEYSCHGTPTITAALAGIYLIGSSNLRCFLINVLMALVLDLVCVAVVKAVARRRRPAPNQDDIFTVDAIDKFSFPSGHAARAVLLAGVLMSRGDWPLPLTPALLAWVCCVASSRVLLRRHYLLDVLGGLVLGYAEYAVTLWLWMDRETCGGWVKWLGGMLDDDVDAEEL